jgi:hypothetical protein
MIACVEAWSRFYVCIVDGKKARQGMGMFVSYTMLTNASRPRSLLAPISPYTSHGRSSACLA